MPTPLTAAELAAALNVTVPTVHGWANAGLIPYSQIGRVRRFDLAEVLAATKREARAPGRPRSVHASYDDEFSELRQRIARRAGRTSESTKKAGRSV